MEVVSQNAQSPHIDLIVHVLIVLKDAEIVVLILAINASVDGIFMKMTVFQTVTLFHLSMMSTQLDKNVFYVQMDVIHAKEAHVQVV